MLERNKLYLGDCLDYMKQLPDKSIDLVLTDPPYGINENYNSYDDSEENLIKLIDSFMPELLRIGKLVALTCGIANIYKYPQPTWILNWTTPAGVGSGKWGFCTWQPILVYGKDPYLSNGMGRRPDSFIHTESTKIKWHIVSKPINIWKKILLRCSIKETDLILDPFAGSCTTAIACIDLKRDWICIEKDEDYYNKSLERIDKHISANHSSNELF